MKMMNKILKNSALLLLLAAALGMSSCTHEVDEIFDEDAVTRLENKSNEYKELLTANGGKWQLEYYANTGEQGYIYLMTFHDDGSVTISASNKWINQVKGGEGKFNTFASENSAWDVISDNGPVLSFASYNTIFHLFATPEDIQELSGSGQTSTDQTGYGHEGDYEFDLMKYSGDTLYLEGKKHGLDMIMTRVSNVDDDEAYLSDINAKASALFSSKVPNQFLTLPNGKRYVISGASTYVMTMYPEGGDYVTENFSMNAIVTPQGLSFREPLELEGYTVRDFTRLDDGTLLCRQDNATTITSGALNQLMCDQSLVWRIDVARSGGQITTLLETINSQLKSRKYKVSYVQFAYNSTEQCYTMTFFTTKGTNTFKPTFYYTIEPQGENGVKMDFRETGDATAVNFLKWSPAMQDFVNVLDGTVMTCSATSLLAPVDLTLTSTANAADVMALSLQ